MEEELAYRHFGTFGLRLYEAEESRSADLWLSFYYDKEGIKKTYPLDSKEDLYSEDNLTSIECEESCRVCSEEDTEFVHSEIGFAIHKDCLDDLEQMISGFLEGLETDIVSKKI